MYGHLTSSGRGSAGGSWLVVAPWPYGRAACKCRCSSRGLVGGRVGARGTAAAGCCGTEHRSSRSRRRGPRSAGVDQGRGCTEAQGQGRSLRAWYSVVVRRARWGRRGARRAQRARVRRSALTAGRRSGRQADALGSAVGRSPRSALFYIYYMYAYIYTRFYLLYLLCKSQK